jgi:hypothetical protein
LPSKWLMAFGRFFVRRSAERIRTFFPSLRVFVVVGSDLTGR